MTQTAIRSSEWINQLSSEWKGFDGDVTPHVESGGWLIPGFAEPVGDFELICFCIDCGWKDDR